VAGAALPVGPEVGVSGTSAMLHDESVSDAELLLLVVCFDALIASRCSICS